MPKIKTQSATVKQPDSSIRLHGNNGFGSSGTAIRRFTDVLKNVGSDITYNDSSVEGASFTINKEGVYFIHYQESYNQTAGSYFGITLNNSSTSTAINAMLSSTTILAINRNYGSGSGTTHELATASVKLSVGDVIRPHTDKIIAGQTPISFIITKMGDYDAYSFSSGDSPKITMPHSELRMADANAWGSATAAVRKYGSIEYLQDSIGAFSITNDTTDGFVLEVLKSGFIHVSANDMNSGAGHYRFGITVNGDPSSVLSSQTAEVIRSHAVTSVNSVNTSYSPAVWSGRVVSGDSIRIIWNGQIAAATANLYQSGFYALFMPDEIELSLGQTDPTIIDNDSMVRLIGAFIYGSESNNKCLRLSNLVENIGSDIEYVDDPVTGAYFNILTSGIYNMAGSAYITATDGLGFMKNVSDTTLSIADQPDEVQLILDYQQDTATAVISCSWQGYLQAGDVIRFMSYNGYADTSTQGVPTARNNWNTCTISKQGNPSANVDISPFTSHAAREKQELNHISGGGSSLLDLTGEIRFDRSLINSTGEGILLLEDDSSNTRTKFVATKSCSVSINFTATISAVGNIFAIYKNDVRIICSGNSSNTGWYVAVSGETLLEVGDYFTIYASSGVYNNADPLMLNVVATAEEEMFFTEATGTLTDWEAYTPLFEGLGTPSEVDFKWSRVATDMYIRGYFVVGTSTSALASVSIPQGKKIGSSLGQGPAMCGYIGQSALTTTDYHIMGTAGDNFFNFSKQDASYSVFTPLQGDHIWSSGRKITFEAKIPIQGWGVAQDSALIGVPKPKVCHIKEIRPTTVSGGTFTSGAWRQRVLNNLTGDPSFVSLNNNQFTLVKGTYVIEADVPGFRVGGHKAKLFNYSDGVDSLLGTNLYANLSPGGGTYSKIIGEVRISSSKTFEIQHRCDTTYASFGFGYPTSFGLEEVYTIIKITKLR